MSPFIQPSRVTRMIIITTSTPFIFNHFLKIEIKLMFPRHKEITAMYIMFTHLLLLLLIRQINPISQLLYTLSSLFISNDIIDNHLCLLTLPPIQDL